MRRLSGAPAEAADRRAAVTEQQARVAAERGELEAEAGGLRVELARSTGSADAAAARAGAAEEALARARVDLGDQRQRHDAAVSVLQDQMAALIAATSAARPAARKPVRKRAAAAESTKTTAGLGRQGPAHGAVRARSQRSAHEHRLAHRRRHHRGLRLPLCLYRQPRLPRDLGSTCTALIDAVRDVQRLPTEWRRRRRSTSWSSTRPTGSRHRGSSSYATSTTAGSSSSACPCLERRLVGPRAR